MARRRKAAAPTATRRVLAADARESKLTALATEMVEAAMMTRRQQESLYQGSYGWDWSFSDPTRNQGNLWGLYDEQPLAVGPTTRYDRDRGDQRPWLETEQQLAVYRMAGRTLCWQYEVAVGVLDCLANYTLGTGMQYAFDAKRIESGPERKELESRIKDAWDDYALRVDWTSQEREIHRRGKRDGEVFLLLAEDGLETVEPEWVIEPPKPEEVNERINKDLDWKWGIATPKMHGYGGANPLAYFVGYPDGAMVAYSVGRMLHVKLNTDRRIKRGLSDFYPVYPAMVAADKITRNTGQGAAVQAAIAYIRENAAGVDKGRAIQMVKGALEMEMDRQTLDGMQVTDTSEYMPSGTVLTVNSGQKYIPGPGSSNSPSYIQVTDAILRYAAIRWQMTDTMISGSSGSANYATALIKESPFVKAIEWEQVWWGNQYRRMAIAMSPVWLPRDIRQAVGGANIAAIQKWFARNIQVTVTGAEAQVRNKAEETNRLKLLYDAKVISLDTWAEIEGFNPEEEREKGTDPAGVAANPESPQGTSSPAPTPDDQGGTDLTPPAEAAAPYLDTAESAGRGLALSHAAAAEYLEAYRQAKMIEKARDMAEGQ